LNEQSDTLIKEANKARADLIIKQKGKAIERDTIKKHTLNFFSDISFDIFSKEETDIVFEWLNNNQALRQKL
jgi:hypothetical protein